MSRVVANKNVSSTPASGQLSFDQKLTQEPVNDREFTGNVANPLQRLSLFDVSDEFVPGHAEKELDCGAVLESPEKRGLLMVQERRCRHCHYPKFMRLFHLGAPGVAAVTADVDCTNAEPPARRENPPRDGS